ARRCASRASRRGTETRSGRPARWPRLRPRRSATCARPSAPGRGRRSSRAARRTAPRGSARPSRRRSPRPGSGRPGCRVCVPGRRRRRPARARRRSCSGSLASPPRVPRPGARARGLAAARMRALDRGLSRRRFWYHSALSRKRRPGEQERAFRGRGICRRTRRDCHSSSGHRRLRRRSGRSRRLAVATGIRIRSLGVKVSEKLEGLQATAETPVAEMEELQGVIAEGQERGFLTADSIASVIDEAELSTQQAQDLLSYLEEHGVELLAAGETAPELSEPIDAASTERSSDDGEELAGEDEEEQAGEDEGRGLRARLEEMRRPEVDLTVEPSLDSLRLYLRSIGRVPLLS